MSEYQYYEFLAIDRPLDGRAQQELRALSSRAKITATQFVNTYEWGNLRGDPRVLMASYFDAFLYLTNWGTRQLMFKLPSSVFELEVVTRYCVTDTACAWTAGGSVIVSLTSEQEDDDWDEDAEGSLGSIVRCAPTWRWATAGCSTWRGCCRWTPECWMTPSSSPLSRQVFVN